MFSEEWPLLMFTLLTQLAVGLYAFLVVVRSLNKKIDRNASINMTRMGMTVVGPIMVVALILSVFHLGSPLGAYRALLNLDSSWLSREILFAGLFFALWLVGFIMERRGKWNQVLGWVNTVVGIGAVFCMASIYGSSILPAWTNVNTFLSFFGTTIVFGAIGAVFTILMSKEEKTPQLLSILKMTSIIGLVAIVFQLIYLPVYTSGLSVNGAAGFESAQLVAGSYLYPTIIRWVLSTGGISLLVFGLFQKTQKLAIYRLSYAAFGLVLVGEFLGRYIFYATGVPIIVG